jgi:hypothetical protein
MVPFIPISDKATGVLRTPTPTHIQLADAASLSSSAVGFEMSRFSGSFGGTFRHVLIYFFGIGLGRWVETVEPYSLAKCCNLPFLFRKAVMFFWR